MLTTLENQKQSPADRAAIARWLEAFSAAVRARDFSAGRALCMPDVFSFCTLADRAEGLDQLESLQWRLVWNATRGFTFDLSQLHCGGQAGNVWAAVPWVSFGMREQQIEFERRGRATIILQGAPSALLAVHTHFSMQPSNEKPGKFLLMAGRSTL